MRFGEERLSKVEVVKFGPALDDSGPSSTSFRKRQSFAVASAYDAINERHPKIVLDYLRVNMCIHLKLWLF